MKQFLYLIFHVRRSAEDPNTLYICLFGRRFVFRNGKYDGSYIA